VTGSGAAIRLSQYRSEPSDSRGSPQNASNRSRAASGGSSSQRSGRSVTAAMMRTCSTRVIASGPVRTCVAPTSP
jgi:hypothetical protein